MTSKRPDLTQRPSSSSKAEADQWVQNGDPTPASTTAAASPAPPPQREPTRRLTLDIPDRLHRAMKIRAATTGVTMLDEVRALLEAHYSDTNT